MSRMPNFLVIGAPKAGTTSLYVYLKEHPQVYMSPVKEPRFFALEGDSLDFCGPGDQETINRTSITTLKDYQAQFAGATNEIAIGEASPQYLYSTKAAERIHHYIPQARLIAVLRNPVDRAFSHFCFKLRARQEPYTDFAQALQAEEQRAQQHWSFFWRYQDMGFYHAQLQRYLERFDRNQIKIYLYEELMRDPVGVAQDAYRFLGVDPAFVPNVGVQYNTGGFIGNPTLHKLIFSPRRLGRVVSPIAQLIPKDTRRLLLRKFSSKPTLSPELRRYLTNVYSADIRNLQDLLQHDLSGWLQGAEEPHATVSA